MNAEKFYMAISRGKTDEVKMLIQEALNRGEEAMAILNEGLLPAMGKVGFQFKNNDIYIPEVLIAARAMHSGMEILKPILSQSVTYQAVKVIIATVKGDLHDIGKNLVVMMLEGGGFEVIDLGINVPADQIVEAIKKHQPKVLGLSALLTTTMGEMETTIQVIEEAGVRNQVKTIVGGAPVTDRFAREIGADGYAPDAASAVDLVKSLTKQKVF